MAHPGMYKDNVILIVAFAVLNAVVILLATAGFMRAVWAFVGPKTGRKLEWLGRFMLHPVRNTLWALSLPLYVIVASWKILSHPHPPLVAQRPAIQQGFTDEESAKFEQLVSRFGPDERRLFTVQMGLLMPRDRHLLLAKLLTLKPGMDARKFNVAARTYEELLLLDEAGDRFMIEHTKITGDGATLENLKAHLVKGTPLYETGKDALGNPYGPFTVGVNPKVPAATFSALADVTDVHYWSPYQQ